LINKKRPPKVDAFCWSPFKGSCRQAA